MKARALQAVLGTTRAVADYGEYIGVGSAYIHDLIHLDKTTLKVRYKLAASFEPPEPRDPELRKIYDKLKELCASGEISYYLNGNDEVPDGVPVFWAKDGEIKESVTEKVAWPGVTREGFMIYENTHFPTRKQAIEDGIRDAESGIKCWTENVQDREQRLAEAHAHLQKCRAQLVAYQQLKAVEA